MFVEEIFQVEDYAIFLAQFADLFYAQFFELFVGYGDDNGVVFVGFVGFYQAQVGGFFYVYPGVGGVYFCVHAFELCDYPKYLAVAGVGAVFLEGDTHDQDIGTHHRQAFFGHRTYQLIRNVIGHAVVQTSSGQDHFGVVTGLGGAVGQVVRVYADAMATDKAGAETQEIPLGAGGFEDLFGIQIQEVEQFGQFVDQRDIDIPLYILD